MIPYLVKIGGRSYDILSDPETSRLTSDDGSRGMTYTERQRIHINSDMGSDLIRETLLHECMHAAWDYVGLAKAGDVDQYQEQIIKALAPTLAAMLRENPMVTDFLAGRDIANVR